MPLFEFQCPDCRHVFEALVRRDERPGKCPKCAGSRLEKLMSATAIGTMSGSLPISGGCPPMEAGPCGPACCRLPGM
ncbi:MAG: zinc ribbon domain-containing protein [Planctomycetaceae bacterium]|nr:zinc ribbon domain-containing protein [Planctomycetaceae bacterium]